MATRRLSRDDWTRGALAMVGELGLERLAVEPLAARLGATKGSFYWHFSDRGALLDAVLEYWAERATAAVIAEIDRAPDPDRLAALIARVTGLSPLSPLSRAEWAILAASDDPRVRPVATRVHRARTDYLVERLENLGVPRTRARARAHICYSAYLGGLVLDHGHPAGPAPERQSPDEQAHDEQTHKEAYQSELLRMITSPE